MVNERLKHKLYIIIFEANTWWGKAFDVGLLVAIVASVGVVMLESVDEYAQRYSSIFWATEWFLTIFFTIEYIVRIIISPAKRKYVFSFFGIIDLLSILPAYLSLVFTGMHSLMILRSFRLLRVFRVFKLARFIGEASHLSQALRASRHKIIVFVVTVGIIVVIMGTVMYLIEGSANGFTSIPRSIYWAIVTLTTVGYGDIAPQTVLGQTLASMLMIMGYGIIAVPTGIVTAEMSKIKETVKFTGKRRCPGCQKKIKAVDAVYCKYCGSEL
jgi:voltage-gated potassium channel